MSDDVTPAQRLEALNARLDRVGQALVEARAEVSDARRSSERRVRVMAFCLFAAVAVALLGLLQGWRAHDALEEFRASRDTARLTACGEDNEDREALNRALLSVVSRDSLARAEAEGRVRQAVEFLLAVRPLRVCTSPAIDNYYVSGGVEGVEPTPLPSFAVEFLEQHGATP